MYSNYTFIITLFELYFFRARYFPTQVPKELNPGVTHYFANKSFANYRVNKQILRTEEKAVEEMMRHILQSTEEGGLVVDLFMGTGTTGVACARTGRRFIG